MGFRVVHIKQLQVKHFRCFDEIKLMLDHPLILITGNNGSGKSSILEALHYSCYLRSFRTFNTRDLIKFGQEALNVSLEVSGDNSTIHQVHIGSSGLEKIVRLDGASVTSYKNLLSHYRVITISADDLRLVQGEPEFRRSFIDQALMLQNPDIVAEIARYRHILERRNALLNAESIDTAMYQLWTQQLWDASVLLQRARRRFIMSINTHLKNFLKQWFDDISSVQLSYAPKKDGDQGSLQQFLARYPTLLDEEKKWGRSCFGAHLDDIAFTIDAKPARYFASRGQQKLVVILVKIALMKTLMGRAILLLDDVLADVDTSRIDRFIGLFKSLDSQIIVTATTSSDYSGRLLLGQGAHHIAMTA
jgi:DNA replication and repair protein RecF